MIVCLWKKEPPLQAMRIVCGAVMRSNHRDHSSILLI